MIPVGTDLRLKRLPVVTLCLIVINTIVYIAWEIPPDSEANPLLEYFIAFLAVFLHADIYHLFFNMLFLWVFGSYLEDKVGSKRFLCYYFVSEIGTSLLHAVFDGRPAIGASGAISGIMGIYLYRCHYSKIKTIVPILFYNIKANINAKWLILLYFLSDVYFCYSTTDSEVAYWGHIGGFLTGVIIGSINRYWPEAKAEHLYERAADSISKRWGLADAEKDLLKVLDMKPDDPAVHRELARLYSRHDARGEKAKQYYLSAARLYYRNEKMKSIAGEVFLQYLTKYKEPVESKIHLQYAYALSNVCDYSGAAKILEPFIEAEDNHDPLQERIFHDYIRFSIKAGAKGYADHAYEKFKMVFPVSLLRTKAGDLLASYEPKIRRKVPIEKAVPSGWWAKVWAEVQHTFDETTTDPLFCVLVLVVLNIFTFFDIFSLSFILPAVLLSFMMTYGVRNVSSCIGKIFEGGNKTESQGLREFNMSNLLNKAIRSEREEKYDHAVQYLEAFLLEDKKREKHLEARYRIARLYHRKLNKPMKAIREYKVVFKTAPENHPFRRDAYESIKELSHIIAVET